MGTLVVVVVVCVVLLGVGLLLGGARATERRTFAFGEGEPIRRVEVELPTGSVTVVGADGGPALVHRTVRWALVRPATSERVEDGVLRIGGGVLRSWSPGADLQYEIEVPAGVDVQVSTGAGAVRVIGTSGDVNLLTRAGAIELANLSGRVRATAQAGKVEGTGLTSGEVEVASNAGTVSLAFDAPPVDVQAQANAGAVELLVPDERYAVDVSSEVGRVDVDVATDPSAPRRLVAHANAGAVIILQR